MRCLLAPAAHLHTSSCRTPPRGGRSRWRGRRWWAGCPRRQCCRSTGRRAARWDAPGGMAGKHSSIRMPPRWKVATYSPGRTGAQWWQERPQIATPSSAPLVGQGTPLPPQLRAPTSMPSKYLGRSAHSFSPMRCSLESPGGQGAGSVQRTGWITTVGSNVRHTDAPTRGCCSPAAARALDGPPMKHPAMPPTRQLELRRQALVPQEGHPVALPAVELRRAPDGVVNREPELAGGRVGVLRPAGARGRTVARGPGGSLRPMEGQASGWVTKKHQQRFIFI